MKRTFLFFIALFICLHLFSQTSSASSSREAGASKLTPGYIDHLCDSADGYVSDKPDSTLFLADEAQRLSLQIRYRRGEGRVLFLKGKVAKQRGHYPEAIALYERSKIIYEEVNNLNGVAGDVLFIGEVHFYQGSYTQSLHYYFQAMKIFETTKSDYGVAISCLKISDCYSKLQYIDSALYYLRKIASIKGDRESIADYLDGKILFAFGRIYLQQGNFLLAKKTFHQSIPYLRKGGEQRTLCEVMLSLAEIFNQTGKDDSTLYYANYSFTQARQAGFVLEVMQAAKFLSRYYKAHERYDSAFVYLENSVTQQDSLFSYEKTAAIQNQQYQDELEKQQFESDQKQTQNKTKIILLLATCLVFLLIAFILWRNNKQKHKANLLLQKQKQEVQKTLSELKALQQQLIQTEKMASLGEVTAGIAHEIQNPLNFITNFSDVGNDLLRELNEELKTGDVAQALELTPMIEQSFQKITEHGKRADAIVKNMMQHARKNTGTREPADLNTIVSDSLRLSYQGVRKKDDSFQANLKTQFDTSLGKINMVPQDMGRVLVNLFNNAFYSVQQKKKQEQNGYEPSVQVTTRKTSDICEIRIRDNGLGIQEKVVDKIYQPFFTTKPAGEGTGLGLSMSYEIITKAHGGQLKVNTRQGEYAEFIVELPLH